MPNDIVDAVHRLAAASKQAGGITFTDKDGNIITEDDEDTEKEAEMEDEPMPIPTTNIENDQAITGVEENDVIDENETEENYNIRLELSNNTNNDNIQEITGVTEEDNNNTVPILEEEKDPDEYVTVEYINIT